MRTTMVVRRTTPLSSLVLFAAAGLALALAGCGASEAPTSGFTQDPALMSKDPRYPFQRTYWNKKFDPKTYTQLYVAPVNTQYVMAQNFWEKVNVANVDPDKVKKDVAMIAQYTRESFIRAAADDPKHRFTVVDKPEGPNTLILELAITQLVPSKAVLNAIGYVTWIPTVVALGGSTATDSQDTGKGVIAIEGRARDGATGEIIGMFADRQHPPTAIVDVKSLNWWAPAKQIIDTWSKQLIQVANLPPGGVVKDMPNFELLVW
ncbi:MAG TPA: DUF3313 domain-containing protein [Tepidisphaeraceae bacterium]